MGERRRSGRWGWIGGLVIAAAAVLLIAPTPAAWIERYYAVPLYPQWQRVITPLADQVSFALFDVWIVVAMVVAVLAVVLAWRRGGPRWRRLLQAVYALLVVGSAVYLWFMASWGLNYRRAPLQTRIDFSRDRVTASAADELAARTIAELNRLHPSAAALPWPDWRDVPRALAGGLDVVADRLSLPPGMQPGRPHLSALQPYFRWASIEGMTNPFLLEVLVNGDLLPMERPAMVAHEWGHLAGLANEAEASYFGWRLCRSGNAQAQYSAWLFIYGHALSAVPGARRTELLARLEAGPRQDLQAIAARQARAVPAVRDAAWVAYDRYLKSNRVAAGVASYDEVLVLILGASENGSISPRSTQP